MWLLVSCTSPKYKSASKNTPPARELAVAFPPAQVATTLNTVIIFSGPGSWKREAFWDEYVVTIRNNGGEPLQVTSATLVDYAGAARLAGDDPWVLERDSKSLERRYKDAGMAFVRIAAPRVLVAAAEPPVVAAAGIGAAGATATATATAVALPVYGLTILGINIHNKAAIKAEFNRRRLPLPLSLAAGESRTGSLFFPMIPNPRSLAVEWSKESGKEDSVLALDFLHGLHMKDSAADR